MRSALIVIGICLSVSFVMAWRMKEAMTTTLPATQDLVLGLIYFMEQNDGRFPASEDEFRASPFVSEQPTGAITIEPPEDTQYSRRVSGRPIPDLAPFEIQWGADLRILDLDDRGNVRDPQGRAVKLIRWPESKPSGKQYSRVLLQQHDYLRTQRDAPAPSTTAPAPAEPQP